MAPKRTLDDFLSARPADCTNGERASKRTSVASSEPTSADDDSVHSGLWGSNGTPSGPLFLNLLADAEATAVYQLMKSTAHSPPVRRCKLSEADRQRLEGLRALPGSQRDGAWWVDSCTCEVWTGADIGHQRWQIDVGAKGPTSTLSRLSKVLSVESLGRLRHLGGKGEKRMVKLFRHHVALNADLDKRAAGYVIPLNVGAGGSVSHQCDTAGCARVCHLETTSLHRNNLDRQRCPGPIIVFYKDQILIEVPCSHGAQAGSTSDEQLRRSCLGGLQLVEHSPDSASILAGLL